MKRIFVGAACSLAVRSVIAAGLLSVGGSYPTQVTLVPGHNTCGSVTVQDMVTTVAHTPGAHALSLTHAGNTYQGTIDDGGRFETTPKTLTFGSAQYTLTITGKFAANGFHATVQVDVKQQIAPQTCSYLVDWVGNKQGDANVIPGAPAKGGDLPGPLPLFPPNNWWNTDISGAPVDRNSSAFINFIGAARMLHPDFGGDSGDASAPIYGIPYIVVAGSQPLVPVTFDYADESDAGAPDRPPGYPIPDEAKTELKWIEGGLAGGDPNANGDRHMLIVDRDNRILYELYATRWNTTANRWEAGSGAVFPLDSNRRRPEGWTSADAAGLAILPGLVRYGEAYGSSPIRHAFRVTLRSTNSYVYPASHRAGSTDGALPMGARLRLKSGKDISSFSDAMQRIFQAMKTYGLIVADNGTDMYIGGTYDTRWDNEVANRAFGSLAAGDFDVVQLGWSPGTGKRTRAVRH